MKVDIVIYRPLVGWHAQTCRVGGRRLVCPIRMNETGKSQEDRPPDLLFYKINPPTADAQVGYRSRRLYLH